MEGKDEQPTKRARLTQFSHGAGCGCKLSPQVLESILNGADHGITAFQTPRLLVGYETKDDAAVFELENGTCIISTTDFFMPIVDDAVEFGSIASANAISDVYAMGGQPIMAIGILGWPVNKLDASVAAQVLDGSRKVCAQAGIPLAGGHSIDSPEPIFGLAVTGTVEKRNVKRNSSATVGCRLFLTKPLGVGILSTAQKKGIVKDEHFKVAVQQMMTLNKIGYEFGLLPGVKAMTDVTGFGLLGHLREMCEGSQVSAQIHLKDVPQFPFLREYLEQGAIPGGTKRNWESYGRHVHFENESTMEFAKEILADPQTNGGLLVAVEPDSCEQFLRIAANHGLSIQSFGVITEAKPVLITVA